MEVDWSILLACYGKASAADVPEAIEFLFSVSPETRRQAYWKIDNYVVVQGSLFESAAYAARILVEKIKKNPEKLNTEVVNILFELANGNAGNANVEHGPLKGQSIQKVCRDTIAELLPILVETQARATKQERLNLQDLLELYDQPA